MTSSDQHRRAVLHALVRGAHSPTVLARMLGDLPWDSEVELVVVRRADLHRMLARALAGEFSHIQIQAWAELLECREDLGYEKQHEELLKSAVFELANPLLTGCALVDLHRQWLERLA